jgi:flotillin
MVVLNGADGMSEMFAKALSLGGTGLGLARQLMDSMGKPADREIDESARKNGELKLSD